MSAPGVLAVMDETATWAQQVADRGGIPQGVRQAANGQAYRQREARATVAELIEAANRAEVMFNTVRGCYERNPGNFMAAMRELELDVIPLRAALARANGDA